MPHSSTITQKVVACSRKAASATRELRFAAPVTHVSRPLDHARAPHEAYLKRFARYGISSLFLGMNPGPWGMSQTGVPFGEVGAVRSFLELEGKVVSPKDAHPNRPIEGFSCAKSEVSGRRFWGLMQQRFGTADAFAASHFVWNWCPLAFMEDSGRNRTPDKLPADERASLTAPCDTCLRELVEILNVPHVIGVGKVAESAARRALPDDVRVTSILHPSPASPAANRDWSGTVTQQLIEQDVWSA